MAYGDVVQTKSSSYADRNAGAGSVAVAFDSAVTAGNIVVVVAYYRSEAATQSVTSSSGETITARAGVANTSFYTAWTLENATAGAKTLTWNFNASPRYSGVTIFEISASSDTVFDSVCYTQWSEDAILHEDAFSEGRRGISFTTALQTYVGSVFDSDVGGGFGTSVQLPGSTGGGNNGFINGYAIKAWTIANSPFCSWNMNSGAAGALIDGDGCILTWVEAAALTAPNSPGTLASHTVNTESSVNAINATSLNLTLAPAPTAGNLLVAGIAWDGDPGARGTDQFVADGWTKLYDNGQVGIWWAKVATGTDDTSLGATWTNSTKAVMAYAEFSGFTLTAGTITLDRAPAVAGAAGGFQSKTDGGILAETRDVALWLYLAVVYRVNLFDNAQAADITPGTWAAAVSTNVGSTGVQISIIGLVNDARTYARATADSASFLSHYGALLLFGIPANASGGDQTFILPDMTAAKLNPGELPHRVHMHMLQMGES